jgi:ferredoxin
VCRYEDHKNMNKLVDGQFENAAKRPDAFVSARLDKSDRQIVMPANTNLLTALEAHQVDVHFQCRDGYCGSCRTTLIAGEVSYTKTPMACLNSNEILPCCCKANGDVVLGL